MNFGTFLEEWISSPLGFALNDILLFVIVAISIIFFALGLRSGLVLFWMTLGLVYMGFYNFGMNTTNVLTMFIVVGVIMVVSLLVSHARARSGVVGL